MYDAIANDPDTIPRRDTGPRPLPLRWPGTQFGNVSIELCGASQAERDGAYLAGSLSRCGRGER